MTKTVLITGGNRGLGKSLVNYFVGQGWKVLATARRVESLPDTLQADCRFSLDLAQHNSVLRFVDTLKERQLAIDCIIHNAGFNPKDVKSEQKDEKVEPAIGYFESTFYCEHFSAANVAESLMINALHPMELTGRLYPLLTKDGGVVVAISSWLGSIGRKTVPGHYGYSGSKTLLNLCMKGLALEFDSERSKDESLKVGRTAVAINPGWMQTAMGGGDRADVSPDEVAKRLFEMVNDGFLQKNNGKFLNTDRTEHEW